MYKDVFSAHLKSSFSKNSTTNLFEPIHYILQLGGKRLRPILTLMSCELFGAKVDQALDAALAIEVFHNFSLVHDDIMDAAPLRRGKPTVHIKWDINAGILSGDAMLVIANQCLESYQDDLYKQLMIVFNKTALEVCQGQQYDIDFENRNDVSISEYIEMIKLKTAVLVGCSLQFGAMIAKASQGDANNIYKFGLNLGIAFQLQDDYLDVFGDQTSGKQKAGDIIENKKTFLILKTLELANPKEKALLMALFDHKNQDNLKVSKVIDLFEKYNIPDLVKKEIRVYTQRAIAHLNKLSLKGDRKKALEDFAHNLMGRKF